MAQYRKKPIVVEAMQFNIKDNAPLLQFISECTDGEPVSKFIKIGIDGNTYIRTLEGNMLVSHNDFVIRGISGEFYPCKPDIFEKTYEPLTKISQP